MAQMISDLGGKDLCGPHLDVHDVKRHLGPGRFRLLADSHRDFLHQGPHFGAPVVKLVVMPDLHGPFHQRNRHHEGQTVIGALAGLWLPRGFARTHNMITGGKGLKPDLLDVVDVRNSRSQLQDRFDGALRKVARRESFEACAHDFEGAGRIGKRWEFEADARAVGEAGLALEDLLGARHAFGRQQGAKNRIP